MVDIIQTKQKRMNFIFMVSDVKLRPASHNVRAQCQHVARVQARRVSRRGACPGPGCQLVSLPISSRGRRCSEQELGRVLATRHLGDTATRDTPYILWSGYNSDGASAEISAAC